MTGGLSNAVSNSFFLNFERICLRVLIGAYYQIYNKKEYDIDWEEDQFSDWLINRMNKHKLTLKYRLFIYPQSLIRKDAPPVDDNHPKKSPKIDIGFWSWSFINAPAQYFFEAKNLCAKDWFKRTGTKVSSSYYYNRYIETGIENFRTERYPNGSLLGYVLNGDIETIVQGINERLKFTQVLIQELIRDNDYEIENYSFFFCSKHVDKRSNPVKIKHIFLSFS